MHLPLTTLLPLLSLLSLVTAHPPIFAPNHATLQKRCPPFDPAGVKNIGNGAGTQFIGGQCLSGADCASGCCANPCGICSGLGAQTQAGKTGCGFGGGGSGSGSGSVGSSTGGTSASGVGNSGVGGDESGSGSDGGRSGSVATVAPLVGAAPTGRVGGGSSCNGP